MTAAPLQRIYWEDLDEPARRARLERPAVRADRETRAQVQRIIEEVRRDGDAALRRLTAALDQVELSALRVGDEEAEAAVAAIGPAAMTAIAAAIANVTRFHEAQVSGSIRVETAPGVCCERLIRPIRAVGLYVPAGNAPLPSTAIMLAIPARIAGCPVRVLCTPPRRDGRADPGVVAAARACGIPQIFKVGGAQAIAAMAFGTESIPKVDKIFGPGNAWVTAAKQEAALDPDGAALDMPAGPSEVMVIADGGANARFVAFDLLSQAEHGPDSQVLLVTTDAALAASVCTEIDAAMPALPRREIIGRALGHGAAIVVADIDTAVGIANRYAPEHLILQVAEPRRWLERVSNAGSVFLGPWTSGSGGRLLQWHQSRAADLRIRAGLQRPFRRRLRTPHDGTGADTGRAPQPRAHRGDSGRSRGSCRARRRRDVADGSDESHMSDVVELIRPEIRKMRPYRSAEFVDGMVRLNANENPWRPPGDTTGRGLNWYPEPRPFRLQHRLAAHYGVDPERLLVTRGSSEGIDVTIRGFCRPGTDGIVICPPTFGMYEAYAQIQSASVRAVPLVRESGYCLDVRGVLDGWTDTDRLLFVCSPNNPTGNLIAGQTIAEVAEALRGRGCVVLDAAYAEFASEDESLRLLERFDNVIVLRTLSKAMALAGIRCGVLLAAPRVVDLLSCVLPPYTFPVPCAEAVTRCLEPDNLAAWQSRVETLKAERARLEAALQNIPGITRVWPSVANFVLAEAADPRRLVAAARAGRVMIRDFSWDPWLPRCVRITVGTPEQNDQLLRALAYP